MQTPNLISTNYEQRLHQVLDAAWRIFQSQFLGGRHSISTEAPFQHQFANILSTVGSLYCLNRNDLFLVDLETKCESIRGKTKYFDITCSFVNSEISCAVELKFKTAQQGAENIGRRDIYKDIEALELASKAGYSFGKFYAITNNARYTRKSQSDEGKFATHQDFISQPGVKRAKEFDVELTHPYLFDWENWEDWYFLDLTIPPISLSSKS